MYQLFCKTDENGEILNSYYGQNIIATEDFDFFFLVNEEVIENVTAYKVAIVKMKPQLVLRDAE